MSSHKLLLFTNDNYRDIAFKSSKSISSGGQQSAQEIVDNVEDSK